MGRGRVTAVLFELGKLLIGLYLGKSGVTEAFAAAGSLVVLVAWVYYAAQIFLLGAEFTKVYARRHGSHVMGVTPSLRFRSSFSDPSRRIGCGPTSKIGALFPRAVDSLALLGFDQPTASARCEGSRDAETGGSR